MKKRYIFIPLTLLLITLITLFSLDFYAYYHTTKKIPTNFFYISNEYVNITNYAIYGTHLNISGNLKLKEDIFQKNKTFNLILNTDKNNEIIVPIEYNIENNILSFKTSSAINQGIYLDSVKCEKILAYIKETDKISGFCKYYKLKNTTKYSNLEYYTITRNNINNKIDIKWSEDTLKITSSQTKLPENYYDIVIDQGHGGKSTGAIANGYTESLITYDYGVKLKKSLEALGLKVLLTRNNRDETIEDYNENGRAVLPNKVKAKFSFSLHINSSTKPEITGVEVYCPSNAELTLGKMLSDNIVKSTNSNYSPNEYGKYNKGVYVLTFSEEVIEECRVEALEDGYEPYNIPLDTPLFFMVREVGGISTHAYIDGRDKKVGTNPYYNSNQTAEGYLLELGFISNINDIKNVTENMDKYVEAITKSIKEYLKI